MECEAETKAKAALSLLEKDRNRKRLGEGAGGSGSSTSDISDDSIREIEKRIEKRIANDAVKVQESQGVAFTNRVPMILWVNMEPDQGIIKALANWQAVYTSVSQNGGDSSPRVVIAVAELGKAALSVKKNDIDRSTPGTLIEKWEQLAQGRSKAKDAGTTVGPVGVPSWSMPVYQGPINGPMIPSGPVFRTIPYQGPVSGQMIPVSGNGFRSLGGAVGGG